MVKRRPQSFCLLFSRSYARDLSFSSDGSRLYSVGDDKQVKIWDTNKDFEEAVRDREAGDKPLDTLMAKVSGTSSVVKLMHFLCCEIMYFL